MIAPPISPWLKPRAPPIPSIAIPIVAIVDQLLPVAKETTAQTTQVANRKIVGFKISSP